MDLKTISANKATVSKSWLLVDANNQILGRLASKVAKIIRGKHKTNFTPHVDCGDNVVIVNAEKIQLTGSKWDNKKYFKHTGYPGGQYIQTPIQLLEKDATKIINNAVKGMLPKNKLGRKIIKNLYIFSGSDHNKDAQKPKLIDLKKF
tara:strand:+ start:192 stop:635 length:444 start_codon:yes stop_codon:yes gene_type:complete